MSSMSTMSSKRTDCEFAEDGSVLSESALHV